MDVGGQSAVSCEAQPGQQRSPSFSSGDFQESGHLCVHWVSSHLPRGEGRDRGVQEPFQRARRPWQAAGRRAWREGQAGEGQGFLPGLGRRLQCRRGGPAPLGSPGSSPSRIWEPREPWDRVSPLSRHTLGCFPKGSRRKEGLLAPGPCGWRPARGGPGAPGCESRPCCLQAR